MKFKVGDKVRCVKQGRYNVSHGWELGKEFIIRNFVCEASSDPCAFPDNGSGVYSSALELVNSPNNKTMAQKIGSMMKKLLDSDTQKLVKASLINGDLELTSQGQQALMAILFEANKAALVKEAEEIISEEEKSKN
jgi:hypothetical protein